MNKKSNLIKDWINLSKPNVWTFVFELIFYLSYVGCVLINPIFAAKVITSLTAPVPNYNAAYLYLLLLLGFLVLRNLFVYLQDIIYAKNYNSIFSNIQSKIYRKILSADTSNFSNTSKEKILNTIGTNIDVASSFIDEIIIKIGDAVRVVAAMIIVFSLNAVVGWLLIAVAVVDFFILKVVNKKLAKATSEVYSARDVIFEDASRLIDGHGIINEFGQKLEYEKIYLQKCEQYNKGMKKYILTKSFRNNWFFVIYNVFITAITLYLVFLLSNNTVNIEVYLILTPYLLSCTELFNTLINTTSLIENLDVSVKRIKTIISFTDSEITKFGKIKQGYGETSVSLIGVSYKNTDRISPYKGMIDDIDITLKTKAINIIQGSKRCGKRIIFNMLRRNIEPDTGVILYDNVNIYDYSTKVWKSKIYYSVREPQFIKGSIIKNLEVACKSRKKIYDMCRQIGIYDYLNGLPDKFDTLVSDELPRGLLFMLGLVRSLLTDCETLMIYELPSIITEADKLLIRQIILKISQNRTVLIFNHNEEYDDLAEIIYKMDNGKVIDFFAK